MTVGIQVYLFTQPFTMLPSFPDLSWLTSPTDNEVSEKMATTPEKYLLFTFQITNSTLSSVLYITYDNEEIIERMSVTTLRKIRSKIIDSGSTNFSETSKVYSSTVFLGAVNIGAGGVYLCHMDINKYSSNHIKYMVTISTATVAGRMVEGMTATTVQQLLKFNWFNLD